MVISSSAKRSIIVMAKNAQDWVDNIVGQLTRSGYYIKEVVTSGEVDKPFRGGSTVKQSSHWYVEIKFTTINVI